MLEVALLVVAATCAVSVLFVLALLPKAVARARRERLAEAPSMPVPPVPPQLPVPVQAPTGRFKRSPATEDILQHHNLL